MCVNRYSWPVRLCSFLMALSLAVFVVGQTRAKAVAVVDDVAVGAMSCEAFLASIGLPLTATGGSSAVTAGVTAAAGEYAAATGAAASGEAFLGTVAAGTAISTAGAIVLTAAAAVAVGAFAYWLYETYFADGDTSATVYDKSGYFDVNGLCVSDDIPFGTRVDFGNGYYLDVNWIDEGAETLEVYFNTEKGLYHQKSDGYSGSTLVYDYLGSFKMVAAEGFTEIYASESLYGTYPKDYHRILRANYSVSTLLGISPQTLSLLVSDAGFESVPEFPDTQQMVIDVGAAPGTTLDDLAQSVPDAIANGNFQPTYNIQVSPAPDPVPVPDPAPEVNPNPDVEAPEDIAPYTVGLGEVFPFCIPFDIYHMVTMFAAEPEAPAATWEFTLPWSGQECEVSWSLEEWDEVAKLCRSLELVLFCVGLAAATYKMIKW